MKTPDEEPFTNDPVQEHELHAPRINSEAICEECGLELQGNEEYYFKLCEKHLTILKNSLPEWSSFNEHNNFQSSQFCYKSRPAIRPGPAALCPPICRGDRRGGTVKIECED